MKVYSTEKLFGTSPIDSVSHVSLTKNVKGLQKPWGDNKKMEKYLKDTKEEGLKDYKEAEKNKKNLK